MHSSTTNRTDGNPIVEEIKSKERIDKFLEISTTVIVVSATVFYFL